MCVWCESVRNKQYRIEKVYFGNETIFNKCCCFPKASVRIETSLWVPDAWGNVTADLPFGNWGSDEMKGLKSWGSDRMEGPMRVPQIEGSCKFGGPTKRSTRSTIKCNCKNKSQLLAYNEMYRETERSRNVNSKGKLLKKKQKQSLKDHLENSYKLSAHHTKRCVLSTSSCFNVDVF